jgi:hypothetical protein
MRGILHIHRKREQGSVYVYTGSKTISLPPPTEDDIFSPSGIMPKLTPHAFIGYIFALLLYFIL